MRRWVLVAGTILSLGLVSAASASAATVTFNSPGTHVWKVPAGVRFATVDLYGAHGYGLGGAGAHVRATIRVKRRHFLTVVVGGAGGAPLAHVGGPGGFGGGGPGGGAARAVDVGSTVFAGVGGGGGGGASDVRAGLGRRGLAGRLLVAGGGGGSAEWPGGAGGRVGANAPPGRAEDAFCRFSPPCPEVPGGQGATATAPGAGGALGLGGAGADGIQFELVSNPVPAVRYGDRGGGGGGGGYFGGGSGGAGLLQDGAALGLHVDRDSTGGGGGSSFVTRRAVCPALFQDGARDGDGLVVITYRPGVGRRRACA